MTAVVFIKALKSRCFSKYALSALVTSTFAVFVEKYRDRGRAYHEHRVAVHLLEGPRPPQSTPQNVDADYQAQACHAKRLSPDVAAGQQARGPRVARHERFPRTRRREQCACNESNQALNERDV